MTAIDDNQAVAARVGVAASTDHSESVSELHRRDNTGPLRIIRADNGCELKVDEFVDGGEQRTLWSIDERLRLMKTSASWQVVTSRQDVVRVDLLSGRRIDLPADHYLREVEGWSLATALRVGSRIATARYLGEPEQLQSMHDSEIVMLAHMIGDGSCVKRQPIRYASIDEANLAAVTDAATHFGVTAIRDEYAAARVTTLRLPAPYRLTHGKRNPIAEWLDGHGLFGLRSYDKFVPAKVFALPNTKIALFLHHLWATDGSVRWDAKTNLGRIYYASTSRRLIDDVMHLLLRVGVQTRITRMVKSGYRDCWHLWIDRADNQLTFLTEVGVHGERSIKAAEVVTQLSARSSRPGGDTIPVEIWYHVRMLMAERKWTDKDFALATNTRFDGALMWTHAPGRRRLLRIANVFGDNLLHDLATSDVYWDKVVDVSRLGMRDVRGIVGSTNHPVVDAVGVVVLGRASEASG